MDNFEFLVGLSLAIFVVISGLRIVNWVWLRPKRIERILRRQGLKGNSYRLLYGDAKEHAAMLGKTMSKPIGITDDFVSRVIPFNEKIINSYGKNSFTWFGPTARVHIMEYEHIKEVFTRHYEFQKPTNNPLTRLLVSGTGSHDGDKWAKHRKIINPAFHVEKLKHMLPGFELSCWELINKWKDILSTKGSPCELDVWPHLQTLTADVISRSAFGSSYEEGRQIFELQRQQTKLIMQALRSVYIPGWRFLPTKTNLRMKKNAKEVEISLRKIINKRVEAIQNGESSKDDLLGILLEQNFNEIQQKNKNSGLSVKEIVEECKLFYFAGQETTTNLLVWTMVLLSQHQNWQERAREEVFQLFGHNKPDLEKLNHLKILTMILYEILRLYPAIVMLGRKIPKDTNLGELTFPAGTLIQIPTILIHRDPEIWGDNAKDFNPERFAEGVSKATKNQLSYFPFGWGPRICVGQNFALLEAKLALTMILQSFSFELSPSYAHAPQVSPTLQPQFGAQLILKNI